MNNRYSPELSGWWLWISIGVFAINNFYFELVYDNWLTGKLSDFTACFFFPLYCSALLNILFKIRIEVRLFAGCFITAIVFTSLKLSLAVSAWHDFWVSKITKALGLGITHNLVDHSDLISLPIILVAYYYGVKRNEDWNH